MIDRLKETLSGAKLPQVSQLSHDLSTKLSTSKTQHSRVAAKQRFTRTITLRLNFSAAEQAVANRQCRV